MADLKEKFIQLFGADGDIRQYFAPGRVNLIGEHTDYNGGHVFPCALTQGIYGVARRQEQSSRIRLYSENFPEQGIVTYALEDAIKRVHGWTDYPMGVIQTFREKGYELSGMDILVDGNIPDGAGLSSSAALEVLTGLIVKDLFGLDVSMTEIAKIGQYAENHFVGCNCGIMDQFASAMGKKNHAIFLDTATLAYEYAPLELKDAKIVIVNSKVKHSLASSAYNDRRNECAEALRELQQVTAIKSLGDLDEAEYEANKDAIKDPVRQKRAKHAVYENQRTIQAVEALKAGKLEVFGKLMNASHRSLRDDYEVSCPEIDLLTELAWSVPGVIGARITGGGFGGCTVNIVKNDAVEAFKKIVGNGYREKYHTEAEFYIAEPGEGAHRLPNHLAQ